jgi:hypothetical protein
MFIYSWAKEGRTFQRMASDLLKDRPLARLHVFPQLKETGWSWWSEFSASSADRAPPPAITPLLDISHDVLAGVSYKKFDVRGRDSPAAILDIDRSPKNR